jgi:hypothetical protein
VTSSNNPEPEGRTVVDERLERPFDSATKTPSTAPTMVLKRVSVVVRLVEEEVGTDRAPPSARRREYLERRLAMLRADVVEQEGGATNTSTRMTRA